MLPLSISARGLSSCRLHVLGKLWPLPRTRREASTWTPSYFDPPRQIRAYYLKKTGNGRCYGSLSLLEHAALISYCSRVLADVHPSTHKRWLVCPPPPHAAALA